MDGRVKPGHDGASCLGEILRRFFDYTTTTLLTTYRAYARQYAASLIEGVMQPRSLRASSGDILKTERGVAFCGDGL